MPVTGANIVRVASHFIGLREVPGVMANPKILEMLRFIDPGISDDAVPWCSAFVCYVANMLGLIYPKQDGLRARSWLDVGAMVEGYEPVNGTQVLTKKSVSVPLPGDIVILRRGGPSSPGPEINLAPGHVGFLLRFLWSQRGATVEIIGGNQSDSVSVNQFPVEDILGIRRIV